MSSCTSNFVLIESASEESNFLAIDCDGARLGRMEDQIGFPEEGKGMVLNRESVVNL
jgi:hypothetical protein